MLACRKWVGLRPARKEVRLETEHLRVEDSEGKPAVLKVVHNYGHGGAGITLHWGCASHAVRLVQDLLPSPKL